MDYNWTADLDEAEKNLLACDRLFYVGLTILKDNRILARTLGELAKSLIRTITAYVKYESQNKKVTLGQDFSENIDLFFKKIAPRYLCPEDRTKVLKLLTVAKIHKSSALEFIRNERLVMYYNGKYEAINKESILEYSKAIKRLISAFPLKKA